MRIDLAQTHGPEQFAQVTSVRNDRIFRVYSAYAHTVSNQNIPHKTSLGSEIHATDSTRNGAARIMPQPASFATGRP